jgi:hypothetical protein
MLPDHNPKAAGSNRRYFDPPLCGSSILTCIGDRFSSGRMIDAIVATPGFFPVEQAAEGS